MDQVEISRITINPDANPIQYKVTITSPDNSKTNHTVSITKEFYQRISGGLRKQEDVVRASVEFLLEREPKESILPNFDLTEIQKYFPEYETLISSQLLM